ncbi:hypothetical protein Xcel_0388 [Xylanimonas cellulosilytica DSM 15894]|uniref:Lipoprotein n=1 Tax=Xylanimonas cellulosilytica (strain DSM 15894 / JCM 12276 / CECT 5975 / KCTC 9989 / LMG 20990 / NBRC 107835 / XIL07) TaxID=446471 RepID=D1BVF6_XYLCX|nr:hypothetical protein [Xylanimonas cellulosilytica]ACZ29427.1 hypothetical protein Xcel_0388 [Xylanimonas cellulosilytica DSM 15894]
MRRTVAGTALVLALALSGCTSPGSTAEPGGAPAAEAAEVAEVAGEGKLDIAAAAERFVAITEPYEKVMAQYHEAETDDAPLETQVGLAGATASALRARVEGLRGTTWPDEVAADLAKLAVADEKAAAEWEAAGTAASVEEAYDAAGRAMAFNTLPEVDAVRTALGIPAGE